MYNKEKWLEKIDQVIAAGPYTDTWESLSKYRVPEWFKDSKFGIFIHWGLYSVPAFGSEWYSRHMYMQETPEFKHHVETYGPQKEFGYKDFIPLFKAEKYQPAEWIKLFEAAGAKYVVPVAEHHDGFQMYKSEVSTWNAYDRGPKRDLLGDLVTAANEDDFIYGASTHRIEHWFFMGHGKAFDSDVTDAEQEGDFYWPAMPEGSHHDLFSEPVPTKAFLDDWMIRTCELIDRYQIKILYFDWWIQHASAKPYLKKIAAYYYNRAAQWGREVVICYKHDAYMFGTALVDIERGQFGSIQPFYWQTDTAVAKNSWCYTENNDFKKPKDLICDLVDIVSKNGNLLLNIGPKADGSITREEVGILTEIGDWLKVNGEGIYGSRVWRQAGEGPTPVAEGQFTDNKEKIFTDADFRFTVKGGSIYVFAMNYPEHGEICVNALGQSNDPNLPQFSGIIDRVEVLGFDEAPAWKQDQQGLYIKTVKVQSDKPVVFKVSLL